MHFSVESIHSKFSYSKVAQFRDTLGYPYRNPYYTYPFYYIFLPTKIWWAHVESITNCETLTCHTLTSYCHGSVDTGRLAAIFSLTATKSYTNYLATKNLPNFEHKYEASYRKRPIYPLARRYLPDHTAREAGRSSATFLLPLTLRISLSLSLSPSPAAQFLLRSWLIFVCFGVAGKKRNKTQNKTPSTSEFGSTAFWSGANKFMSSSGLDNDAKGATKLADGTKNGKWFRPRLSQR